MQSLDNTTFFKLLHMRSDFENLLENLEIPEERSSGTIDNIKWFIKHGNQKNRFREGYDEAFNLCNDFLKELNNGT